MQRDELYLNNIFFTFSKIQRKKCVLILELITVRPNLMSKLISSFMSSTGSMLQAQMF